MESINIADRDMLLWAGSPNEFNDGNSNDFIVNEDVIVKYFKISYSYVIYSNISDDIIKSSLYLNGICCIKYIYLEKTKIIFKFDC